MYENDFQSFGYKIVWFELLSFIFVFFELIYKLFEGLSSYLYLSV